MVYLALHPNLLRNTITRIDVWAGTRAGFQQHSKTDQKKIFGTSGVWLSVSGRVLEKWIRYHP